MKTYDDVFPGPIKPVGLFHVFGAPGVGKSTFCVTTGIDPSRYVVLDFESSLSMAHEQLGFGVYHNMISEWVESRGLASPQYELYRYVMELIADVDPVSTDIIIIDNIEFLETAIQAYVEQFPEQFGLTRGQIERGRGLKWGAIKKLYAVIIQLMLAKAKLVGFTSGLGQAWFDDKPIPGLFKPKGKQNVLEAQTFLRLWLESRADGPEPAALVLKSRLSRFELADGLVRPRPVLPRRLPVATWDRIRYYFDHPADLDNPPQDERLSEVDRHKLRGTLSKEQLDLLKLMLENQRQRDLEANKPGNPAEFVVMVKEELGMELQDALSLLGKSIGDLDLPADYHALKAMRDAG